MSDLSSMIRILSVLLWLVIIINMVQSPQSNLSAAKNEPRMKVGMMAVHHDSRHCRNHEQGLIVVYGQYDRHGLL
jgi:hypothetical protein